MSEDLPLEGLRVLDLTTVIMGPFTTQVLGDFGADIIKIEDPNGDMTRDIGPSRSDKMSSMYLAVLSPGLIPGTKPPYFLKFSAVSSGLNTIEV